MSNPSQSRSPNPATGPALPSRGMITIANCLMYVCSAVAIACIVRLVSRGSNTAGMIVMAVVVALMAIAYVLRAAAAHDLAVQAGYMEPNEY